MFDNTILKILMDRYGHIEDIGQLEAAISQGIMSEKYTKKTELKEFRHKDEGSFRVRDG